MYGFYLQSVRPNDWCDVDSFLKWFNTWKLAKKWGRESQFYILVIFLGVIPLVPVDVSKVPWGILAIFFQVILRHYYYPLQYC